MKLNLFLVMIMALAFLTPYQAEAGTETDNCFAFENAGDYQNAIEAGKKAVELYPKDVYADYCLGVAYLNTGQFKLALTYMKEAEGLSTSNEDMMLIYNQLGLILWKMGDYDNALFYGNKYLFLARKLGKSIAEATALNNIAVCFLSKGMTDKALGYYEESLKIADEKDKATTYDNIGMIYSLKGEYQKAIEYRKKAVETAERNGNYHGVGVYTLNLGINYRETKDFVHAEEYLTQGLKMILKVGDKYWEANAYKHLGWLYKDKGDKQRAKDYLTKAYKLFDSIGAKDGAQDVLVSLKELDNSKGTAK